MKVIVDCEKVLGNYLVDVKTESPTEEFLESVKRNGAPTVDFGGVFKEVDESGLEVELFKFNSNVKEISQDLSFSRIFKTSQFRENTEKYATLYANTIKENIESSLTELKSKVDDFSSNDFEIQF